MPSNSSPLPKLSFFVIILLFLFPTDARVHPTTTSAVFTTTKFTPHSGTTSKIYTPAVTPKTNHPSSSFYSKPITTLVQSSAMEQASLVNALSNEATFVNIQTIIPGNRPLPNARINHMTHTYQREIVTPGMGSSGNSIVFGRVWSRRLSAGILVIWILLCGAFWE
ncbi:15196_t:CDS:1 [Acaulospora colombiana]|uniref:15196_t:CDS:1 n=1 Tax=Acaulospora colombiana TaxID=27376 RepID=A0ACA9LMB5_9GLOM|nr:15196_t:CDS:1 [Acaulospora colombiana]